MAKIRILAIPPDQYGVGKFRISDPYTYIQENYPDDFHVDIKTNVENNISEFENYDIIVAYSFIHNSLPYQENLDRVNSLKKMGKIVIIDNDDYWSPDLRHPQYNQIIKDKIPKQKIELLRSASYITVTTPIFRDNIIKKLGFKNVFVFPNAVDETEPQFIPAPTKSDRLRFGWIGGSSHKCDIDLIESGISSTLNTSLDKVQFVLCGFDTRGIITEYNKTTKETKKRPIKPEETVWFQYEKMFTKNYTVLDPDYVNFLRSFKDEVYDDINKPYRRIWTKDINKYAMGYNEFDISLIPLVESEFNSNKSQLKIIEAGFHKKAIIASEINPYLLDLIPMIEKEGRINPKGNALLVSTSKNHKQWGQYMIRLLHNLNMIEDLGSNLYETVKDKYSLKKVCKDRVEFLKSII